MSRPTTSVEATIRQASSSTGENGDDDGFGSISVGDTSMRLPDVDPSGGGASRLGKASVGSAALQAALTLHPCVHVSGCGDASEEAMRTMLATVGRCVVRLHTDDDGAPTGEASATYEDAATAVAAIERFDGTRFDDGMLSVCAAQQAARGSLTRRGRTEKMTFHDRQQEQFAQARAAQAADEKSAFSQARAAANDRAQNAKLYGSVSTGAPAAVPPPRKPAPPKPSLPGFLVRASPKGASADTSGALKRAAPATSDDDAARAQRQRADAPVGDGAARDEGTPAAANALGSMLAAYGSDDSDD